MKQINKIVKSPGPLYAPCKGVHRWGSQHLGNSANMDPIRQAKQAYHHQNPCNKQCLNSQFNKQPSIQFAHFKNLLSRKVQKLCNIGLNGNWQIRSELVCHDAIRPVLLHSIQLKGSQCKSSIMYAAHIFNKTRRS